MTFVCSELGQGTTVAGGSVVGCWGLCQCLWCSLCCCMLFVSYIGVLCCDVL